MQVLIFPSWYFPAGTPEIPGRMFHHLAGGLRESGLDARIFYPDYSPTGPLLKRSQFETEADVPTYRVRRGFPPRQNAFLYRLWVNACVHDLTRYCKKHGRPDVLHAQSYMAASVCARLQKEMRIPYVYTERLSSFLTGSVPSFHLPFFKDIFATASLVTCVSPGLAEILEHHVPKPIRIVPNFFDEALFYPDPTVSKNEIFTWVSVGEPSQIKGLDLLLQAFAALQQVVGTAKPMRLVMVDRIPEQAELMKQANSLGIDHDITWTGLLPQKEIADILRKSHALVSASRVETFGKAIIEALGCGLPVVATKTPGASFILKGSRGGSAASGEMESSGKSGMLAEINNVPSLTRAMGTLMSGYNQYQAREIHESAARRFGKKVIIHQWIDIYNNLSA